MVTFECPWCAEPASVDSAELEELTCDACGLQAELASDPVGRRDRPGSLRDELIADRRDPLAGKHDPEIAILGKGLGPWV
jgi:hypothetical protein